MVMDKCDCPIPMTKDEIVEKLVRIIDVYEGGDALFSNQGQAMDGYSALAEFVSLAKIARDNKEDTK